MRKHPNVAPAPLFWSNLSIITLSHIWHPSAPCPLTPPQSQYLIMSELMGLGVIRHTGHCPPHNKKYLINVFLPKNIYFDKMIWDILRYFRYYLSKNPCVREKIHASINGSIRFWLREWKFHFLLKWFVVRGGNLKHFPFRECHFLSRASSSASARLRGWRGPIRCAAVAASWRGGGGWWRPFNQLTSSTRRTK